MAGAGDQVYAGTQVFGLLRFAPGDGASGHDAVAFRFGCDELAGGLAEVRSMAPALEPLLLFLRGFESVFLAVEAVGFVAGLLFGGEGLDGFVVAGDGVDLAAAGEVGVPEGHGWRSLRGRLRYGVGVGCSSAGAGGAYAGSVRA